MNRIYWITNLRVLATLTVIMLHAASNGVFAYGRISLHDWWICNVFNAFGRFAVPVFVILSGYLLLDRYDDLRTFLGKRLNRIVVPFIIWLFIYMIHGTFWGIRSEQVSWLSADWLIRIFTNNASGSGQLWFVYMLVGLYLFTPILARWLKTAPQNEVVFFLAIWLLSNTGFVLLPKIFGFKPAFDFRYFTGFAGYFVFGFYLKKWATETFFQKGFLGLVLFVLGWVGTVWAAGYYTQQNAQFDGFLGYESPFVVLMSVGIVVFFKNILDRPIAETIFTEIDASSYGIFLMHWLVMKILSREFRINYTLWHSPALGILTHFLLTAIVCTLVIGLVRRLPKGHWITG